jgi:hypothetical protein
MGLRLGMDVVVDLSLVLGSLMDHTHNSMETGNCSKGSKVSEEADEVDLLLLFHFLKKG